MANTRAFIPVRIAVLTVSDTRSVEQDKSGQVLVDRLTAAGHKLADRTMLHDERAEIADQLRQWIADPAIDVILSTGGTGLTGRDVTVEAHRDVYEKEIDAFGTVFTMNLNTASLCASEPLSHSICAGEIYWALLSPLVEGSRSPRQSSTKTSAPRPQRKLFQIRFTSASFWRKGWNSRKV